MDKTLKPILKEAVKYWERRRLVYNIALAVVVLITVGVQNAWPELLTVGSFITFFMMAFIANVLFSFAYLPDIVLRYADISEDWQYTGRNLIFVSGTLFSLVLAFSLTLGIVDPMGHWD